MKHTFTILTITLLGWASASAEGYQVNTLSARQGGMGHTGVALKLGAESMYFNPAGMAYMNSQLDISAAVSGIMPSATATIDGHEYDTSMKVSTPIMISGAFSIYDNLKGGISFYTPYGSNIDWGNNWPGAVLNQSVKLTTYTIQPTLAWRITPRLSVGAGLMMSWGSEDLNKGLVTGASMDATLALLNAAGMANTGAYSFGNTTPASVNLTGTTGIVWGFNIGAMYDITDRITVGAQYRSKMTVKVKNGDASLTYANEIAQAVLQERLDMINNANFSASMPMPAILTFGASYRPVDRLTLAADAQLTFWNAYKSLDIDFLDDKLEAFDQHITKDYSNSWAIRLGAQYALTSRFDIRAGFVADFTPVNTTYYNPETPGMTKLEPTAGFSFRPVKGLSVDFSLMYIAGIGEDKATCPYTDILAPVRNLMTGGNENPEKQLSGKYNLHAFAPTFGLSYTF